MNMNYESLSGMLDSLYLYILTLILSQAAVLSAALQLCNLFYWRTSLTADEPRITHEL